MQQQTLFTKVTVPKGTIVFPVTCSCCGQPSDRRVTIERERPMPIPLPVPGTGAMIRFSKRLSLEIPTCSACDAAIRWRSSDWLGRVIFETIIKFLFLCFALTIAFAILSVATGLTLAGNVQGITVMAGAAILALLWSRSRVRAKNAAVLAGDHVCNEFAPIRIATFDADSVSLIFAREANARTFGEANHAMRVEGCDVSGAAIS